MYGIALKVYVLIGVCFSGDMYFHGPWYVHPSDVDHAPNRLFYKNEVFKSSIEDTNPVLSIQVR